MKIICKEYYRNDDNNMQGMCKENICIYFAVTKSHCMRKLR